MKPAILSLTIMAMSMQIPQASTQYARPAPLSTSPMSCDTPDRDARIIVQMYPRFPDVYVKGLEEGQSIPVDVTIFADGRVSAVLPKTTGAAAVDATAIAAAEGSSYSPAIRRCKEVSSAFTVSIFYRRRTDSPAPCDLPDQHAFVVSLPPLIWNRKLTSGGLRTTGVTIAVGANASVTSATVTRSSGNALLDTIALRDAESALVEPSVHRCKTRPDGVAYDVAFDPALPMPNAPCHVRDREVTPTSVAPPIFPNVNDPTFGSAVVKVRLLIAATGGIQSAKVVLTSGYPSIDAAALRAALMTKFDPKVLDCVALPSEFVYVAEFWD